MKSVSPTIAAMVLAVTFVSLGTARLVKNFVAGNPLRVELRAGLSHPFLLGGQRQTAFIKIDLNGFAIERASERTPVNLALVIDKSGSMQGEKLDKALAATLMAVDRLGPDDVVSVIAYDNQARVLVPATRVADKEAIRRQIRSLRAGGGTALYAGVALGADEMREFLDPSRVNRVILLSDGQANEGPSTPSELGDLGASLVHDGISVTTIGLGLGYNEDLMTQLALRSDGNHNFVEDVENLQGVFDQEFGDVLSVVAQDVSVTIDCADGIRPVRVLGRPATIDGQKVTVALNQLYSEQDKYIMLEVEAEPPAEGGQMDVARVSTSYANMVTESADELTANVSAQVTDSEDLVEKEVDKPAMAAAVEQQGILNEERAIRLRDEDKIVEAEEALNDNASYLESSAARYGAKRLYEDAQKSREAIGNLDGSRWNQQRKAFRADHYKAKVQQGGK